MFREMRRKKQQLSEEDIQAVLKRGTSGVLAVIGDEGYPYAVPMSYVFADGKIYMHSALSGHKIDAINTDDRVSFCVIDADDVMPADFTTQFRSVIAFGRARIIEDDEEKLAALRCLGDRYNPGQEEAVSAEAMKGLQRLHMIEITIEHLSGKEALALSRARL